MTSPITIAPHLQRALDVMSKDMAVEPQALVNQAVFAWLRINGYVLPGAAPQVEVPAPAIVAAPPAVLAEVPAVAPAVAPVVPVAAPVRSIPTPIPAPPPPPPPPVVVPVAAAPVSPPPPGVAVPPSEVAPALARMAQIDADLEKLTRPWPAWAPVAPEEPEADEAEDEMPEDEAPREEATSAAAPAVEREEPVDDPSLDANTGESEMHEGPADSTIVLRSAPIALYLEREGEEPIRVTSDRFIIGRGPHCDLVIDSPRVSREHVALTRSGILFFIEDLNSSNGTWFGEERVTKRELESGDVINLGNEPVTFFLRAE